MTTEIKRHPLAIAWDEWRDSKDGKHAIQHDSLPRNTTPERCLENHLYRAFHAGAKAAEEAERKRIVERVGAMRDEWMKKEREALNSAERRSSNDPPYFDGKATGADEILAEINKGV